MSTVPRSVLAIEGRFRVRLELVAITAGLAAPSILLVILPVADYLGVWSALVDHALGLFFAVAIALMGIGGLLAAGYRALPTNVRIPSATDWKRSAAIIVVLGLCTTEWVLHADGQNPWLASSRPEANEDRWLTADGYAMLLDGHLAQNDGSFLLGMLSMFADAAPAVPSDFDRRAGHLYLVSLLVRPLGSYWAFATTNLFAWWVGALSVWWLGNRLWPAQAVGFIGALLVATGQGFIFTGTAPQPHAVAYGAFALLLVLHERWNLTSAATRFVHWLGLGWVIGAGSLVYFVHIPFLMYVWLATGIRTSFAGKLGATIVTGCILIAWQLFGTVLGLRFEGGNNDYAMAALENWVIMVGKGVQDLISWGHYSSPRGVIIGAFWYPWLALAACGWWFSPSPARSWSRTVIVAAFVPALVFTTRFQLPRVAYFAFPAICLLAACGIVGFANMSPGRQHAPVRILLTVLLLGMLFLITNLDIVTGSQHFAVDFHYAPGSEW